MEFDLTLVPWRTHRDEVLGLEIAPHQKGFIDDESVAAFLTAAAEHPTFDSYAVRVGDTVVGLVCYGQEVDHGPWRRWIPLLVIDHRYQGNGYGRATMQAVIDRVVSEAPECRALGLGCKLENGVALALYRSLGFEPGATDARGELEMWLTLAPST